MSALQASVRPVNSQERAILVHLALPLAHTHIQTEHRSPMAILDLVGNVEALAPRSTARFAALVAGAAVQRLSVHVEGLVPGQAPLHEHRVQLDAPLRLALAVEHVELGVLAEDDLSHD